MSAIHFRGSHIRLIARYYAKNLLRGGMGILFTLAALFVGLSIAAGCLTPVEALHKAARQQQKQAAAGMPNPQAAGPGVQKKDIVEGVTQEIGLPVAKWATGGDEEQAKFLVRQRPALVSAIMMILIFCLPFLVCLGSFNQLSGDIQYKGLRYLLLRTERANIFFGRLIGTLLFTLAVLGIVFLVLFLYLAFKARFYPTWEVFLWMLHGYFAVALFALPYIALCAWISAALDSPFLSLVICEMLTIFPIVFVAVATNVNQHLEFLGWVTPWPFKFTLLHYNPLFVLGAACDMLLFTALFLFLGMRHFQRRDL